MTLLLKGGQVLEKGNLVEKNIFIEDSTIKDVSKKVYDADKIINVSGKIILPGIIDPHVHFREPGFEHKEDFLSGSRAAAKGGVTTFLDMPNTTPPTITVEALEGKRQLAKKSIVNYGFHFGSMGDNIDEIKKAKNIASVKLFLDISTGKMCVENMDKLNAVFSMAKMVAVHAEGKNVSKAVELAKAHKKKLYLCHISAGEEIEYIRKNKTKQIYTEVSPHHLFLTRNDCKQLKAFAEMKPGLKSEADRDVLWEAIDDGTVDTIGTDHAPHTKEEKKKIMSTPYGVPGVETSLPLMLNAVNENRITLKRISELMCENPAKIFGIKRKGFIQQGFDADLVIIDMDLEKEIVDDELETKCRWSPFAGMKLKGWPVMTIVRGEIVFENGKILKGKAKEVEFNE